MYFPVSVKWAIQLIIVKEHQLWCKSIGYISRWIFFSLPSGNEEYFMEMKDRKVTRNHSYDL